MGSSEGGVSNECKRSLNGLRICVKGQIHSGCDRGRIRGNSQWGRIRGMGIRNSERVTWCDPTYCAACSAAAMFSATSHPRHLCTAPNTVDQLRSSPPVSCSLLSQCLNISMQHARTLAPSSALVLSSR